nr:MAG TPA: hypothetical protein [Caudoviricetes sp.]
MEPKGDEEPKGLRREAQGFNQSQGQPTRRRAYSVGTPDIPLQDRRPVGAISPIPLHTKQQVQ